MLLLAIEKRDGKQNAVEVRRKGLVPAVFYGRKERSTPISVRRGDFIKVWKSAGESSIITLKDGDDEKQVLIQDVSRDPVTGVPIHADFYVVEKDKKLKVKVPIEFVGMAPAVKDLGGILVKVLHEVEIESLPKDLPSRITVDIGALVDLKSQILAKDIVLPTGVALIAHADEVVAAITEAKVEEEKPPEAIDLSAIEVEKKGKEAKEGEEAVAEGAEAPKAAEK